MHFAHADIFADEMRLGDEHVKFGGSSPEFAGAYSMTRHSVAASKLNVEACRLLPAGMVFKPRYRPMPCCR